MRLLIACLLATMSASVCSAAHGDEPITIESLLHEMTDRESLAQFPSPTYTCRQSSSYDRDSVSPDKPGWFANWDRSQFVRVEEKNGKKEYVLLDEEGPGAIVRFWTTWHGPGGEPFSNGTLRIYIDGKDEAEIQGPYVDMIGGGGLVGEPISHRVSPLTQFKHRAHNLYLPIPYSSHCKIIYETDVPIDPGARTGEALYYQINYRTYSKDTKVESFSMERLGELKQKIDQTQTILRQNKRPELGSSVKSLTGNIEPNKNISIELEGPSAIYAVKMTLSAKDLEQALRSTVLQIEFDGKATVWCPAGDFFGTGYKINPYSSWYTEVSEDGVLSCYWLMPFEKSAKVSLLNLGKQPVTIERGQVFTNPWQWNEQSMYFNASWKCWDQIEAKFANGMTGQGAVDLNWVTITGKGQYVGDTLTLFNGAAKWWGEGDEKIYIDGEDFPSHFGTGTEDYFGYAWCRPEYFASPFHAQPDGGGNLAGGFSVNSRYRMLDTIPFTKSLRFDMELWHWANTKMDYAPATFWYALPGATCNAQPDPKAAQLAVAHIASDVASVWRVEDAFEGESLRIVKHTGGSVQVQQADFHWSGGTQLWWVDPTAGDTMVLEFPVQQAGRFKVFANLTKADDYGVVQLTVNDGPSKQFDRFHPTVKHDLLELGAFDLKPGANRLAIKIVGENKNAKPRRMFGLDYLLLKQAAGGE